jgi:teichuronic acid biosynthesis glycosyltransferase TuaG
MPRVSVIVPAYNAAATIEASVAGIAGQSFGDWELIVADDASTDDTGARAVTAHPRCRVVRADQNAGPAAARNLGISIASGGLLAFLDADDEWLPTYLESQVAAFDRACERGIHVGVVACDAYICSPGDTDLSERYRAVLPFPPAVTLDTLLDGNPICVSALVSAEALRSVGGFDVTNHGCEDHDLWLKLVEAGWSIVDNPEALVVYRLTTNSVSSNRARMARSAQTTYRRALERGRLTKHQAQKARRALAVNIAIERLERLGRRPSPRGVVQALQSLIVITLFVLTSPNQWTKWWHMARHGALRLWRGGLR